MPRDRDNKYPVRRNSPTDRPESYNDRKTGLSDPPRERRRQQAVERMPQVVTPAADVATIAGTHNHTGVYSPVGHTHTSGSITDFTEAAQDAALGVIGDSTTIDATYNDVGNVQALDVIANSSIQKITHRKNSGSDVGSRKRVNWIEGANITIAVADDAVGDEVDVTITGSAGGGVSGAPGGLVILEERAFSGAASVSFDNVFTSAYDDYLIEIEDLTTSTNANPSLRLRVAGVDLSSASYLYAGWGVNSGGATGVRNSAGATSWLMGIPGAALLSATLSVKVARPARVDITEFVSEGGMTASGNSVYENLYGYNTSALAYDGFTFLPSAGTVSGTIRVYGMIKSVGALAAGPADSPHLVQKQSFTGQTTVSFNNVFTSKYQNYRIIGRIAMSAAAVLNARLRAAGVDNSASSYFTASSVSSSSLALAQSGASAGTAWVPHVSGGVTSTDVYFSFDVSSPSLADDTMGISHDTANYATGVFGLWAAHAHRVASAFDGITFFPGSGTMDGAIAIYGIPDSVAAITNFTTESIVATRIWNGTNAENLDGIFTTAYDWYTLECEFDNYPTGDNVTLQFRAGGATLSAAAYYCGYIAGLNTGGASGALNSGNTSMFIVLGSASGVTTSSGVITIGPRPATARGASEMLGVWFNGNIWRGGLDIGAWMIGGGYIATNAIDGVRLFLNSGGNMTGGRIVVKGRVYA